MRKVLFLVLAIVLTAGFCFAEEASESGNTGSAAISLGEVIVTAGIFPESTGLYSGSQEVIHAEDAKIYGLDSISDVLDLVPGAYVKRNGGGSTLQGLVIRGSYPRQNTIMIDGVPMGENIVMGGTDLSLYDISDASRIEVLKGDMSSLLGGNAAGGVVNVITGRNDGKFFTQEVSYGTFNSKKFVSTMDFNIAGADVRLNGTDESSDGYIANSDYKKNTLKGSLDYKSGEYSSKASVFYVKREMGSPGSIAYPSLTDRQNDEGLNASVQGLAELDFMDVKISGSMNRSDLVYYGMYPGRTRADDYTAGLSFAAGKGSMFSFNGGYETNIKNINGDKIGARVIKNNAVVSRAGVKLLDDALELAASGRFDSNTAYKNILSGGFNASYQVMKELKTYAVISTGFSEPTIAQLYWPEDSWSEPNPDLKSETSVSYEGGAGYSGGPVKADVSVYYRDVRNLIANDYSRDRYFPININSAGIFGVEASADYLFGETAGISAEYALLLGNDKAAGTRLPEMPVHKTSAKAFIKLFEKLTLSGVCEYTGDRMDYSSAKVDGYFLARAKAMYKLDNNFSFSADINNVFDNRTYQVVKGYRMPGREVTASINAGF